tara:strand:+ start:52 stop:468 length:417 start_codon:yes stop_codon:yes gene_type:complete
MSYTEQYAGFTPSPDTSGGSTTACLTNAVNTVSWHPTFNAVGENAPGLSVIGEGGADPTALMTDSTPLSLINSVQSGGRRKNKKKKKKSRRLKRSNRSRLNSRSKKSKSRSKVKKVRKSLCKRSMKKKRKSKSRRSLR